MSELPMKALPQEEQRRMSQLYMLLGKQVKRYHKHRHMGDNTSVSVELAQELMASVQYTLDLAGGIIAGGDVEEQLQIGQNLLETRVQKAKSMLALITATVPSWQTECRCEALRCMEAYLTNYDHLHLAHRIPEELYYPILVPVPDEARGIDHCLFYLTVMWYENQIMAGIGDREGELFWDRLSPDTLNQCEQLLINGVGKAMLYPAADSLVFEEQERTQLVLTLRGIPSGELRELLDRAAVRLCEWLGVSETGAAAYVQAVVPQLMPRLEGALPRNDLWAIFI